MQTQDVVSWFIIYEFQVLSDNPMYHKHLVNKRIRNTCPVHPAMPKTSEFIINLGAFVAGKERNRIHIRT